MRGGRRDFARGPEVFRRDKPPLRPSGKAFLIVTEGEKTEPNYFRAVRDRLELAAVEVTIVHPACTDPLTLVREAVRLRDEQNARARQSFGAVPYDEVWVVFDLEQTHDERRKLAVQAKGLKGAGEVHFAISDPAFEYWLLLHAEYTTAAFKDGAAVLRALKKHWRDYTKSGMPSAEFLETGVPKAVIHARQRRKAQLDPKHPEHPFTDVDLLICELNAATRGHLRYLITPSPPSAC